MSLNEERILILKMLEEGKITSEEAERLLDALDSSQKQTSQDNSSKQQKGSSSQDNSSSTDDSFNNWRKDYKRNSKHKDFDRVMDDFASKAEKLGKNLAATTSGFVDKVVDFMGSFVDTNAFNFFGGCPAVERCYETTAYEGQELYIEGINSSVSVKKHSLDKIIIKSKIRSRQTPPENMLVFNESKNAVSLKINKLGNVSISHEVFLPALMFGKINIETSNGKIIAEDTEAKSFIAVTKNSHIELMGVKSDDIQLTTKNAKIQLGYTSGKNIDIRTNNSLIDIKHIKAENVKAVTMNGRILVENAKNYDNCSEVRMHLKTTNGSIKVNMSDIDNRGYQIKAQTTNGGINLLIPEMVYNKLNRHGITGSFVEAESNGYSEYPLKAVIYAETMNGYIEVVK